MSLRNENAVKINTSDQKIKIFIQNPKNKYFPKN